jgi:HMGL-like
MMTEEVTICEVSPRDGLQNEPIFVPTSDKVRLIDLLSASGIRYIEAASFVSPKWVPQMADGKEVLAGITRRNGVVYSALSRTNRTVRFMYHMNCPLLLCPADRPARSRRRLEGWSAGRRASKRFTLPPLSVRVRARRPG